MSNIIHDLPDQRVRTIGRVEDIGYISFGETLWLEDEQGNRNRGGTYLLYLERHWRIIHPDAGRILLASHDIFEPNSHTKWTKEFEESGWNQEGANLFDEKLGRLKKGKGPSYVLDVSINQFGDLQINFSNGWKLESFMDFTTDAESWRFSKRGSEAEKDMVCTGLGLE